MAVKRRLAVPAEITPGSFALVGAVRLKETGGVYSARVSHYRVACGTCEQVGVSFAVMPGSSEADPGGWWSLRWWCWRWSRSPGPPASRSECSRFWHGGDR
jgi:hypothetical protein